jgi:hypothetical protein
LLACLLARARRGCACSALLSLLSLLSLRSLLSLEAKPAIEWQRAACTLASRWHTTREGSYSCVQRDLEPANQACSCASLDRGLHELAGMLALRSSVSSNLQFPASTSLLRSLHHLYPGTRLEHPRCSRVQTMEDRCDSSLVRPEFSQLHCSRTQTIHLPAVSQLSAGTAVRG